MNPLTNWKTTLLGAVLAALVVLQQYLSEGGDLTDYKQWILPTLIALIMALMPDPKSGNGMKLPLILLLGLCLCCLCSCQSLTPERTRALADIGLTILESRGYVAPQDADDIRLLGNEVLPLRKPVPVTFSK
jgi:hypothetical protein